MVVLKGMRGGRGYHIWSLLYLIRIHHRIFGGSPILRHLCFDFKKKSV